MRNFGAHALTIHTACSLAIGRGIWTNLESGHFYVVVLRAKLPGRTVKSGKLSRSAEERVRKGVLGLRWECPEKVSRTGARWSLHSAKVHSLRIYPYPMVWPLPRPWSDTMVSIPLWAQKTLEIKGFLGLERPFLDLVSQTPRPRGRGRPLFAEKWDFEVLHRCERLFQDARDPKHPSALSPKHFWSIQDTLARDPKHPLALSPKHFWSICLIWQLYQGARLEIVVLALKLAMPSVYLHVQHVLMRAKSWSMGGGSQKLTKKSHIEEDLGRWGAFKSTLRLPSDTKLLRK